jgi:hypothetical protein
MKFKRLPTACIQGVDIAVARYALVLIGISEE